MCFFEEKKSDFFEIFDILPKNIRTLAREFFSKVVRKVSQKSKGTFWRKEIIFGVKSKVFHLIPAFEQKSLLVWGKRLNQVIRSAIYLSKEAFWDFFWNEIYFFSFHFKKWAKRIRFWRKTIGKVVKTSCSEEHFEENWSFCSKT